MERRITDRLVATDIAIENRADGAATENRADGSR